MELMSLIKIFLISRTTRTTRTTRLGRQRSWVLSDVQRRKWESWLQQWDHNCLICQPRPTSRVCCRLPLSWACRSCWLQRWLLGVEDYWCYRRGSQTSRSSHRCTRTTAKSLKNRKFVSFLLYKIWISQHTKHVLQNLSLFVPGTWSGPLHHRIKLSGMLWLQLF